MEAFDSKLITYSANESSPEPPCKIKVLKGSQRVAVTEETANYLANSKLGVAFFNWIEKTLHPEEHFYSTLGINEYKIRRSGSIVIQQRYEN